MARMIPKGSSLTPADDAEFEDLATGELEKVAPAEWDDLLGFWKFLAVAHPATRRRLLAKALRICSTKGAVPSDRLVGWIDGELAPKPARRAERIPGLKQKVAHYLVRHPRSGSRKIAAAIGHKTHTAVEQLLRADDDDGVWRVVAEELAAFDAESAHALYMEHCARFGVTFEYGNRTGVALSELAESMRAALNGERGPVTQDDVRAARGQSRARQEPAALEARLVHTKNVR